jgi:hypothetical protein
MQMKADQCHDSLKLARSLKAAWSLKAVPLKAIQAAGTLWADRDEPGDNRNRHGAAGFRPRSAMPPDALANRIRPIHPLVVRIAGFAMPDLVFPPLRPAPSMLNACQPF